MMLIGLTWKQFDKDGSRGGTLMKSKPSRSNGGTRCSTLQGQEMLSAPLSTEAARQVVQAATLKQPFI